MRYRNNLCSILNNLLCCFKRRCRCKCVCRCCPEDNRCNVPKPRILGWMRSSETTGFVPGARIPIIPQEDFNGWDYKWVRANTQMQFFENNDILDAVLLGEHTREALGTYETVFNIDEIRVGEEYIWDGGTDHQFSTEYYTGSIPGGWSSWANVDIPFDYLYSPQTRDLIPGVYSPYHYSLRRFTTYFDLDLNCYNVDSAFLVSKFTGYSENQFAFPVNDSLFIFVNGVFVYWTSSNLIGGTGVAQLRLFFDGVQGIEVVREDPINPIFTFTDGWYLALDNNNPIFNIAPFLRNGKNVVDLIADDFFESGGMSHIDIEFSTSPINGA